MPKAKIAITMRKDLLDEIDRLTEEGMFANRSRAIEAAVAEKVVRIRKTRLLRECQKLEPLIEKKLAEEGFEKDASEWPEY